MDEKQARRDIFFGTIALIWGSLVAISGILDAKDSSFDAYEFGQLIAVMFGVLFAIVGFYYRRRGYATRRRLKEDA